ncbi:MAG: 30S ribosomal protein S8 [Candidatus Pacebacteria bacterium]|nr:30S ribosomal protein S8 [Candidatus Paceibacterota bacterium]
MDKIGDMLVMIKNGGAAGKKSVHIPYSGYKMNIARALFQEGYIKSYVQKNTKKGDVLEIDLLEKDGKPKINQVQRVSKPSRRLYTNAKHITSVKQGHGSVFLSTPKGILTGKAAKKEHVGGEILFEIW